MLGEGSNLEPKPGRLYVTSELGDEVLQWIDPETGEILYETPTWFQAKYTPHLKPLTGVPAMLIKMKEHSDSVRFFDFLVYEKILRIVLRKEQTFNDYFIQASA